MNGPSAQCIPLFSADLILEHGHLVGLPIELPEFEAAIRVALGGAATGGVHLPDVLPPAGRVRRRKVREPVLDRVRRRALYAHVETHSAPCAPLGRVFEAARARVPPADSRVCAARTRRADEC